MGILLLVLIAFAWPSVNTGPRDLPLAVAGPPAAVQQVEQLLAQREPEGFDVVAVPDRAAAVDQVLDRDVYGAVVLTAQGPGEVLIASAASPAVAQLLTQAAQSLAQPADGRATGLEVTDVAPTPAADPRGAGLSAGALPLTIGGIVTGTLMALLVRGAGRKVVGVLTAVAVGAPLAVAVLHGWLGALDGDWWAETAAVAAGLSAVAFTLVGLHALFGRAGLLVGDLALVLLGNPLSGATSAPELLPNGWSELGHAMPLGATVDLLRGISGFAGRGTLEPSLTLAAWSLLGLLLLGAAALRKRPVAAAQPQDRQAVAA